MLGAVRVVVTGATGFLGGHIVTSLLSRGHDIRAFARARSRTDALEARGVEIFRGDLEDPASVAAGLEGAEGLVHAAGGGIVREVADFARNNTDSTRALLEGLPDSIERFVLVSSLAAHGPSAAGRPAVESDADAPLSHYGRSKRAAERLALARSDDLGVVVLRPPALYGPGEHRMVDLFRAARRGFVPMVHRAGTLSLLHGADCAEAIACALDTRASGLYYVAEPRVYRRAEMARAIGRAVGREVRVVPIPLGLLRTASLGAELGARLSGRPAMLTRDKVRDLSQRHQACDPSRAVDVLGWSPTRDFASGAEEAYADYRRRGWL